MEQRMEQRVNVSHFVLFVIIKLLRWLSIMPYNRRLFLKRDYLKMHIFFQNNKRRWCIKTETGKHQQYISNGFTLSFDVHNSCTFVERGPPKQGPIKGLLLKDQDKDSSYKDHSCT